MWSVFGTTDEIVTGPIGSLCPESKKAVYAYGSWCGHCLSKNKMRTWVDNDEKICPWCEEILTKDDRVKE